MYTVGLKIFNDFVSIELISINSFIMIGATLSL